MPVGAVPSVPPRIATMLAAIQQSQAAELAVATQLEQGFQAGAAASDPNLGQLVNLSA